MIEYEVKRQLESIKNNKKINKEVRKAEPDFTTSFLRPMPGAARLYPETDVLPVRVDKGHIKKIKKALPRLLSERVEEFSEKYKMPKELAKELIENENFEILKQKFRNEDEFIILRTLANTPREYKSKLNIEDFEEILGYYFQKKITKEAIMDLLEKKALGEKIDINRFEAISEKALEEEIKEIIKEKPGLSQSAYMGLAMAKHRGRVEGKKVMEMINKYI